MEIAESGVQRVVGGGHRGVGGDLRAVLTEPALEAGLADGGQLAVGVGQIVNARFDDGIADLEGYAVLLVAKTAGIGRGVDVHGEAALRQRHRTGGVGAGDGHGVLSRAELTEGAGAVQVPQVVVIYGALDAAGGGEAGFAVGGGHPHRDVGDGQTAGDHAAEGVGGLAGHQLGGGVLAAGIEHTLRAPRAADGGELERGSGAAVTGGGHRVGAQRQQQAGAAVFQIVGAVAHQLPHLVVPGSGSGQRHLAAYVGQTLPADAQGVIAAGVVGQLNGGGTGSRRQAGQIGGQRLIGGPVGGDAVIAVSQRRLGVGVQHHQGVRRFVDVQAAVDAELHIAGAADEVGHGLAGHAVLVGGVAGHALLHTLGGGGAETAALVIDGLDQLGLALVLEAAQLVEGPEYHAGGAAAAVAAVGALDDAGAVVYAAAPQHVAQRHGVVVQIKGGDGGLQVAQQVRVGVGLPVVLLGLGELLRIGVAHAAPVGVEVAAVAGRVFAVDVVGVGVVQPVAHIAVEGTGVERLQPLDKAQRRAGIAGEHVDAVGRAAQVAVHRGVVAGIGVVARLVVLAQIAQTRAQPVLAGGQQRGGQQTQHQRGGQHRGGPSFHPFHRIYPAFAKESVERCGSTG